jgi:hypothetical protein
VYQAISRNDSGVEGVVFLGVVPMLLALVGIRRYPAMRTSWLIAGAALAVGPSLHIAGRVVSIVPSFLMPYGLLSRMPYGDIPRVPARFAVMTTLCLSILAAAGALAIFKRRGSRRAITATLVLAVLIPAEHAIMPLPVADAGAPAFYERLRDEPGRGGVLEVPIPDDLAAFPQRMLYQTIHEKPVYGGYLARGLPPRSRRRSVFGLPPRPSGKIAAWRYRSDQRPSPRCRCDGATRPITTRRPSIVPPASVFWI